MTTCAEGPILPVLIFMSTQDLFFLTETNLVLRLRLFDDTQFQFETIRICSIICKKNNNKKKKKLKDTCVAK